MRRDSAWLIPACLVGLLVQLLITTSPAESEWPKWASIAIGATISLAVLTVVAALNRAEVSCRQSAGQPITFLVRPGKATIAALGIFLAFSGALFLTLYLAGDLDRDVSARLGTLPIWAMGFGIYSTAYFNDSL